MQIWKGMGGDPPASVYRYKGWLRFDAVVCLLFLIGGTASPGAQSPSAADILSPIIEAMKNTQSGYGSGRGTVLREEEKNGESTGQIVEFRYKGEFTRSDFYDAENGQKGSLALVEASNDRNGISYEPKGEDAYIFSTARGTFLRRFGNDMHPATFECYAANNGMDLHECLQHMRDASIRKETVLEANLNAQGILQVKVDCFPQNASDASAEKRWLTVNVDTRDGFRLVSWSDSEENSDGPGSTRQRAMTLTWKKYGSQWYIDSAEQKDDRVVVRDTSDNPIAPEKRHECIKVKVLHYEPDPKIDDKEFTLNALGIKAGTKVRDTITRVTYGYSGPAVLEDSLAVPLDDADGIRRRVDKISAQQDGNSAGDAGDGKAMADLGDASETPSTKGLAGDGAAGMGSGSTPKYWTYLFAIGACMIVVLVLRSLYRMKRG